MVAHDAPVVWEKGKGYPHLRRIYFFMKGKSYILKIGYFWVNITVEKYLYMQKILNTNDELFHDHLAIAASLTLCTLISVCIFSILFSIHFLLCWEEEFVSLLRAISVGDHWL